MSARRLIGLLLTLFTFHLMLVGPDNVCVEHAPSSQAGVTTGMAMDHAAPGTGMDHGTSKNPCDTPSSAHCCDAFASCAVTAALDAAERLFAVTTPASLIPAPVEAPLLSRALGPEPPPPRA